MGDSCLWLPPAATSIGGAVSLVIATFTTITVATTSANAAAAVAAYALAALSFTVAHRRRLRAFHQTAASAPLRPASQTAIDRRREW